MLIQRVVGYLKERVAFLVETGTRSKVVRLAVPRWGLGVAALVMVCLVGGVLSFMAGGGLGYNLSRLERENQEILARYHELEETADSLSGHLALIEKHDIQLRISNSMEVLPQDVRRLGVGGSMVESKEMIELRETAPSHYEDVAGISETIVGLSRRMHYQTESFAEIESELDKYEEIRNHIPSIVPTTGHYCGKFGYRTDPILGIRKLHCGVDITNKRGTHIFATADGVVSYAGSITGYGKIIKIDHGNCIQTVYAHLSAIYVEVGQEVSRFELIGAMGNSGRTVGTHLHYEVRVAGRAVNPEGYFLDGEEVLTQYPMP